MKRYIAVIVLMAGMLTSAGFRQNQATGQNQSAGPDRFVLKKEEADAFDGAMKAAHDAELEAERADARRDAAIAEVRRLVAYTVGEHGFKPSQYGIKDGRIVEIASPDDGRWSK